MLTEAANSANAPRAVMWSVAQVAERDGVSRPTVSIRVKRFVEQHGLTVERDGQGRVARLNVAEYDSLRGRYDDPSKAQAPRARADADLPAPGESYDEALRQKTWLETERRRIDLEQIRGKLVDTQSVAEGHDRAAAIMVDIIDRLDDHEDDLAPIVVKDGLRAALKHLRVLMRRDAADRLRSEARRLRAALTDAVATGAQ